jgi:hypothetical protein
MPSSRKRGATTPFPQYAFLAWYLVKKLRKIFTFYMVVVKRGNKTWCGKQNYIFLEKIVDIRR